MRNFLLVALGILGLTTSAHGIEKTWTFVVWMNADNNLCSYAGKNLSDLQSINVSKQANVLIVFDCSKKNDSQTFEIQGQKRVVIDSGKEYDMGDYRFLTNTVNDLFKKYPAKHKMLTIWNHGSGWKNMLLSLQTRGVSYDDQSGNFITTPQLGMIVDALNQSGNHLDILGFDACLMQMIEVAYEVGSKNVDYIVASEETEPGDGWDYNGIAQSLQANPSPIEFGRAIVNSYYSQYPNQGATQSIVELASAEKLSEEFGRFISTYPEKDKIYAAMKAAQSFYYSEYKDFGSFMEKMNDPLALQDLNVLFSQAVVYAQGASGLSIYYTANPLNNYFDLKFAKETGWLK